MVLDSFGWKYLSLCNVILGGLAVIRLSESDV